MDDANKHSLRGLNESDVDASPFKQFERWFRQALEAQLDLPDAMTLATATKDGVPSARMVMLRGSDERGFVFYTNYESPKGRQLAENSRAALVFYWRELGRQVRITGRVSKVSREESEHYFRSRPREARLAAWASDQSEVITSREALERRLEQLRAEYEGEEIPLPPYWGGYRVLPETFEFWQEHPNRLHDRFRYSQQAGGGWCIERLAP